MKQTQSHDKTLILLKLNSKNYVFVGQVLLFLMTFNQTTKQIVRKIFWAIKRNNYRVRHKNFGKSSIPWQEPPCTETTSIFHCLYKNQISVTKPRIITIQKEGLEMIYSLVTNAPKINYTLNFKIKSMRKRFH